MQELALWGVEPLHDREAVEINGGGGRIAYALGWLAGALVATLEGMADNLPDNPRYTGDWMG